MAVIEYIIFEKNGVVVRPYSPRHVVYDGKYLNIKSANIRSIHCKNELYLTSFDSITIEDCCIDCLDIRGNVKFILNKTKVKTMFLDVRSVQFHNNCDIEYCRIAAGECYSPVGALNQFHKNSIIRGILSVARQYSKWKCPWSPLVRYARTQYKLVRGRWILCSKARSIRLLRYHAPKDKIVLNSTRDIIYTD